MSSNVVMFTSPVFQLLALLFVLCHGSVGHIPHLAILLFLIPGLRRPLAFSFEWTWLRQAELVLEVATNVIIIHVSGAGRPNNTKFPPGVC